MAILYIVRKDNLSAINVCIFRFLSRIGFEMVTQKPKQYFSSLLKMDQKLSNRLEIWQQDRATKKEALTKNFKSIRQLHWTQEHISLRLRKATITQKQTERFEKAESNPLKIHPRIHIRNGIS